MTGNCSWSYNTRKSTRQEGWAFVSVALVLAADRNCVSKLDHIYWITVGFGTFLTMKMGLSGQKNCERAVHYSKVALLVIYPK